MIEIRYEGEKSQIIHDGKIYSLESLITHLKENGHKREVVGYAVAPEHYSECKGIARQVENLYNQRKGL